MRRREFIGLIGAAAAALPLGARAQQPDRIARIGLLSALSAAQEAAEDAQFQWGLRELGWVEGKNLHIESRYAEGHMDRLPALTSELVGLNVDVIVTAGPGVYAAHSVTSAVPIVAATAADLVAMGIAASLWHPGGNVTGLNFFVPELMAKRLELLKQAAPSVIRAGVLVPKGSPSTRSLLDVMDGTALKLELDLSLIEVVGADFESAFSAAPGKPIDGLVSTDSAVLFANAAEIASIAEKRGIASIGSPVFASKGGLLGYGVEFGPMFRRAATFVDAILKGAKPGNIPIEMATKFTTIINLKTAKALKLDVPATLLAGADDVIE
jgi:putative ABC transport system substrate-binding protein